MEPTCRTLEGAGTCDLEDRLPQEPLFRCVESSASRGHRRATLYWKMEGKRVIDDQRAYLKREWKEAKSREIELPEDDPNVVSAYFHWVYRNIIPMKSMAQLSREDPEQSVFDTLAQLELSLSERLLQITAGLHSPPLLLRTA